MPTVSGVGYYASIQQPKLKYQSEDKEYSIQVLLEDEAAAKAWNKQFKKQKAKSIDAEEFEQQFKVKPPFEADEYFTITLKREATYQDGNPLKEDDKPKVYILGDNGKLKDITATKLIGNGSIVTVSYTERTNDYGTFAKLRNVRVDTLIEYVSKGTDSELGEIDDGSDEFEDAPKPKPKVVEAKPVVKAEAKPEVLKPTPKPQAKKKVEVVEDGEEETEDPF